MQVLTARGINNNGQAIAVATLVLEPETYALIINNAGQIIGTPATSEGWGANDSGQVVGRSWSSREGSWASLPVLMERA